MLLALGLLAYNISLVNFKNPLQGDSTIALIGMVAALCAVILLLIFRTSQKIRERLKED